MADIQFTSGVFRDFQATVQFHLGKIQQDVKKDTVLQFDGTILKLDGVQHPIPELRSAIKAGWLVLVGDNVGDYIPQSAHVKVRAAQDTGKGKQASTVVQQDETLVGKARKAPTVDGVSIQSKAFNSKLIKDTEGDGRSVGPATKRSSVGDASSEGASVAKIKTAAKKTFTVDGSTSMNAGVDDSADVTEVVEHTGNARSNELEITREGQSSDTGRVIANVKTAARRKVVLTDANAAEAEINKLDNATRKALLPQGKMGISAASGDSVQEILEANDNPGKVLAEQKRAVRLARLAADGLKPGTVAKAVAVVEVEDLEQAVADAMRVLSAAKEALVAAQSAVGKAKAPAAAKASKKAAVKASKKASKKAPVKAPVKAPAKAPASQKRAVVKRDMGDVGDVPVVNVTPPPGAIDAPVKSSKVEAKSPKSIEDFAVNGSALELAPGFRWDKQVHWKSRVKMAIQYKDNPEKMALIRGYEVPSVVKQIDFELSKGR